MNALRSIGKLVWGGGKDNPELMRLTSGVLYEVDSTSKVSRKCIYKEAQLSIRRTNTDFNYQLAAQRVFEEGEQDLEEDVDEVLDEERAFLIGRELQFAPTVIEGGTQHGFKWVDSLSPNLQFEYIVDDEVANKATRETFNLLVARCVWERKTCKQYTDQDVDEVQDIVDRHEHEQLDKVLENVHIDDSELDAAVNAVEQDAAAEAKAKASAAAATTKAEEYKWELPPEPASMAEGDIVVSTLGGLYMFDASTGIFAQVCEEVALTVVKIEDFTYFMNVASDDRVYCSQQIEPSMNAIFNHDHRSLIWNYFDQNERAYSFSVMSAGEKHYEALHQGMAKAAYETLNQEPWHKVSGSSQDYMLNAYEEDVDMLSVPDDWHRESDAEEAEIEADGSEEEVYETDEYESEEEGEESEEESYDEESDVEELDARGSGGAAKNSMLAVGYKHGRSFVVRGNQIGVFRHNDSNDGIRFDTTITKIDDTHGRKFTPSAVQLHEQDSSMVLMDKDHPHDLYKMDLEYGKVVEEWKVHEDIPTVSIAPTSKYSQMTGDKTLVGLSHNLLYRIDPRIGGDNLVAQDEMQAYTTKSHFTSAATTENGAIAVGSAKGEIRLFDRLGVRAKTMLPALGEPILGIDVTSDGRYVVATCKTYLLLVDTKLPNDSSGRTGFDKAFPQAQKPTPRRLQLKPEHVVYMGAPISFTPAKFNQSPDGNASEKTIVTSTGPFVVTWNLRRALGAGRGDAYHIKQYADVVVADNFRFGQDRSIVVTLPNDVQSVKRSQLARPTRETLMVRSQPSTPAGSMGRRQGRGGLLSDRDNVVDAPY